ncbi:MAG: DUF3795 domain-containing protein [Oscillospiraceae bacterium]|nr:DUF3795 domain-containing protein [Oscillospiraceae bacterium]
MDKKELIAPCGLDCFNCNLLEDNLTDEVRDRVAAYRGIAPEEVACKGCRAERGKCRYAQFDCATWNCAQEKQVSTASNAAYSPAGCWPPRRRGRISPTT